jgi:hypothetical protein
MLELSAPPGPAPREPQQEQDPPTCQCETWTCPLSGIRMNRLSLGACLSGRLLTKPLTKSAGTDLLWIGQSSVGAFDHRLRTTIADSWQRLNLYKDDVLQPRLIKTRVKHLFWVCRLEAGIHMIEQRQGGGNELYQLRRHWIRRPT